MPWLRKRLWLQVTTSQSENQWKQPKINLLLIPERTTSCSPPTPNYWLHTRRALVMGFVLSDGQAHGNLRKHSWEKRDWCQRVSTAATSHLPETSSWSSCLPCLNTTQQKERLPASREHLHSSETQRNFLCTWGDHVRQFLGKHADVVGVNSQKVKQLFSSLGCWEVTAVFPKRNS